MFLVQHNKCLSMHILICAVFFIAPCQAAEPDSEGRSVIPALIGGAAAGVADVAVSQPLNYWKNMRQIDAEIFREPSDIYNIRMWYRGSSAQLLNMVPTTMIQVGSEEQLKSLFPGDGLIAKTARAFSGGVISAPTAAATNAVILRMQKDQIGLADALKSIYKAGGARSLFRGTTPTAGREAVYAWGYLVGYPELTSVCRDFLGDEILARACAGILAGSAIAIVSHPFDTVATRMQNRYDQHTVSIAKEARRLYQAEGLQGFFRGLTPRASAIIIGITVMSEVCSTAKEGATRLAEQ